MSKNLTVKERMEALLAGKVLHFTNGTGIYYRLNDDRLQARQKSADSWINSLCCLLPDENQTVTLAEPEEDPDRALGAAARKVAMEIKDEAMVTTVLIEFARLIKKQTKLEVAEALDSARKRAGHDLVPVWLTDAIRSLKGEN